MKKVIMLSMISITSFSLFSNNIFEQNNNTFNNIRDYLDKELKLDLETKELIEQQIINAFDERELFEESLNNILRIDLDNYNYLELTANKDNPETNLITKAALKHNAINTELHDFKREKLHPLMHQAIKDTLDFIRKLTILGFVKYGKESTMLYNTIMQKIRIFLASKPDLQ